MRLVSQSYICSWWLIKSSLVYQLTGFTNYNNLISLTITICQSLNYLDNLCYIWQHIADHAVANVRSYKHDIDLNDVRIWSITRNMLVTIISVLLIY